MSVVLYAEIDVFAQTLLTKLHNGSKMNLCISLVGTRKKSIGGKEND